MRAAVSAAAAQPECPPMRPVHVLRNAAYGCLFLLLLTVLRTMQRGVGGAAASDEVAVHPRFRRSILDASTAAEADAPDERTLSLSSPAAPSDVFISVKTTAKYHRSRVRDILDTWFTTAPDDIYFYSDSDGDDAELSRETGGHVVNTNCTSGHSRQALCCKMGAEYDGYLASGKSWWCHFDDDNYVNVVQLRALLSKFDTNKDLYLGRPSTRHPIEILDRNASPEKISFWFATGGAGFCVSRSLATKMQPYAAGGGLVRIGDFIRMPDDVSLGYIIVHLLDRQLTFVKQFHSHLESMKHLERDSLRHQVSLSSGSYNAKVTNVVDVDEYFAAEADPSRFRNVHCLLFPSAAICPTSPSVNR